MGTPGSVSAGEKLFCSHNVYSSITDNARHHGTCSPAAHAASFSSLIQDANIEDLVLSGKLFNPPSRSSSPVRSRSPSPSPAQWPNDDSEFDYDSDAERRRAIEDKIARQQREQDSIGMGPGRTGVKGVIKDRNEAQTMARAKRAHEIDALNHAMEKASLGGLTWAEEERQRQAEKAREEGRSSTAAARGMFSKGRFGHLREVGERGFVQAIESEDRNVWVVVHIYDPVCRRVSLSLWSMLS